MVVCDEDTPFLLPESATGSGGVTGLISGLKRLFGGDNNSGGGRSSVIGHDIIGFVGFWVMADEAHITAIAVKEGYQRLGIGELLMTSVIDRARRFSARIVTLEVRVSNTGAQRLYSRYGFSKVGIRKGYYTDNREDAVIMSTEYIGSPAYKALLSELKKDLSKKLGSPVQKVRR
jgi:ribosomal-protein-alanine N-acetyltransferase